MKLPKFRLPHIRFSKPKMRPVAHYIGHRGFLYAILLYSLFWFVIERGNIGWDGFMGMVTMIALHEVQRSANRDTTSTFARIDAIVEATPGAPSELVRAEEKSEQEIEQLRSGPPNGQH